MQVWLLPAATDVALLMPLTVTGVVLVVVLPLPSWPCPLMPQHVTVPLPVIAQVWLLPAASAVASLTPLTVTGVRL